MQVCIYTFYILRLKHDRSPRGCKIYAVDNKLPPVWWSGVKNSPNVANACRKRRLK
jgi:hypothetical protein